MAVVPDLIRLNAGQAGIQEVYKYFKQPDSTSSAE
jgi:hypothetical protein